MTLVNEELLIKCVDALGGQLSTLTNFFSINGISLNCC